MKLLRVEQHPLGLRLYLFGMRFHEWHLGVGLLLAVAVGAAGGAVQFTFTTVLVLLAGVWLVAKDWHDLLPSRRDTAAWRLGLHRRPHPLRALHRADPLPTGAALGALFLAAINLASALTPNVAWRGHALLQIESVAALRVSHAIAIPVAAALVVTAVYLRRRRRRALYVASLLLVALCILNLTKGLDFEEAAIDAVAAGLLWLGRDSFYVRHDPLRARGALWRIPALLGGCFLVSLAVVWVAAPGGEGAVLLVRETGDLLSWQRGPLSFHDELTRLDLGVGVLGALTLLVCGYLLFRPLAAPRSLPDPDLRKAAAELVRAHGTDTLAYFKLRHDKHYLFSADRRAFLGYRIENRVLLVSGDLVGAAASIPALLTEVSNFAEHRGLHLAAIGVSEQMRVGFEQLGLRALYLGDEAIIDVESFSLEGRPIRKVRQSVTRLEKAGYRAQLHPLSTIDEPAAGELERISENWREGQPERGFSMSLDEIRREDQGDTVIVVARDSNGCARAFLHLVPSFGRPAMSLSFMRRERDSPNGLTEFLVVRAIMLLRERGIRELSLNFAAFAQLIHSPRGQTQRLLGRVVALTDTFFQIESLYRFNAKFFPRWEPRYFLFQGLLGLPRAGLAAMWAEGQLPQTRSASGRRHQRAGS